MNKPSTTTTTATTATTTSTLSDDFILIFNQSCRDVFSRIMPAMITKQAIYYAEHLGEQTVIDAIYETVYAPRPSWRYTLAILRNCELDGVTCYEDYIARQRRFNGEF